MDIKKLKNFFSFKLPFSNFKIPQKPLNSTLTEIRVFETAQSDPLCPICGSLLKDYRKRLQGSPDVLDDFAPIEGSRSGRTDNINPFPHDWTCQLCSAPVIFNENLDKEDKPIPAIAQSSSR